MSGYSKQCMARKSILCALTRAQAQIDRLTKERDEARQEGTAAGCVVAINVMRADRDRAERERDEARAERDGQRGMVLALQKEVDQLRSDLDHAETKWHEAEKESDNDLADVQALTKQLMETSDELVAQNAALKESLTYADEACHEKQAIIERLMESERQAVALLRQWRDDDGIPSATHTSKRGRTDAFLAGQPAPVKLTVDDATLRRALVAWDDCKSEYDRDRMSAALVAALEGRT